MQDCVDLLANKGFYSPYGPKVAVENDEKLRYYIRGGDLSGIQVEETWNNAIITKPISVTAAHAWLKENPDAFIAALSEE